MTQSQKARTKILFKKAIYLVWSLNRLFQTVNMPLVQTEDTMADVVT